MDIKDVIVIGGGPAGVSASVYLKRYDLDILLLNKGFIGGAVTTTFVVDNYPGFHSISGFELSNNFKKQLDYLEVPQINEEVLSVSKENDVFIIKGKNNTYYSRFLLVTAGREHNKLGLPNEDKFIGKGISYCSTCDGPLTRNKNVIVVGGGNSAFEEVLFISKFASNIKMLVRNKITADKYLVDKVKELSNVEIHLEEEVKEIVGQEFIEKIVTNKGEYEANFLFAFIGLTPNIKFLENLNIETKYNHIIVDEKMETSVEGLYAAGDVIYKKMYQIVNSAAEGSEAAYNINAKKENLWPKL